MSKKMNHAEDARALLKSRLEKAQGELNSLDEERRHKKVEVNTLAKGLRAFERTTKSQPDGKVAPTLQHVAKGIQLAFQGRTRMSRQELEQRTMQILSSQEALSSQGLALRIKQGIAKLESDGEGFVIAPLAKA